MGGGIDPERLAGLRSRMVWTLFAVSALGSTGYIAAVTAGTLAAAEIAGSAAPGGLPTATSTLGTAAAAAILSFLMLRVGRRPGLLLGIVVGILGAAVALFGVLSASLPLLLAGSALAGFANGAGQLGRYVAADLVPADRRARTIGTVVWGSTIVPLSAARTWSLPRASRLSRSACRRWPAPTCSPSPVSAWRGRSRSSSCGRSRTSWPIHRPLPSIRREPSPSPSAR